MQFGTNEILPAGTSPEDVQTVVVFGNGMMPLYRHGDRLVVSEKAPIKVGDRVVLKTASHGTVGGTLIHWDKQGMAINLGGAARKDLLIDLADLQFLGRIIWASQ